MAQYILDHEKTTGEGNTLLASWAYLYEKKGLFRISRQEPTNWISVIMRDIQNRNESKGWIKALKVIVKKEFCIDSTPLDIPHRYIRHYDGYQNCYMHLVD